MARIIQWGVLGAANIAVERTMPAMLQAPSARLVALASRDPIKGRRVAESFDIPHLHDSYEALLANPAVDAVYVPLPNQLHFEWALKALDAGKHVLCEKPLCLSAAQVGQLIQARDRAGLHIEEGLAFRNHPQWAALQQAGVQGSLGAVRAAHITLAKQFLDPVDIRNNPNAGGGALYDLGVYAISACNLVFQRAPTRVVAALEYDPVFGIDRLSSALLDYGDCHAALTVATQAGPDGWGTHQRLAVLGATGWAHFDFPCAHARPSECHLQVGDHHSVGAFPSQVLSFEPVNHYQLQVERFSRKLLGDDVPSWPIEDALATLRTLEALFASQRSGGWEAVQ